ncbi:Hypothetical protein, putative [Bodo saltans]|uniref:Uncharacterized protein n=1 Tax=Bodo saltans TaxID=75058 RepID=A0A0S4JRK5_BODSA|nr:Hypothetical protein, putative [Bodo saltans]|eukprot:CUG94144.1 Hypothetical protein, putative [Bodo saltans]
MTSIHDDDTIAPAHLEQLDAFDDPISSDHEGFRDEHDECADDDDDAANDDDDDFVGEDDNDSSAASHQSENDALTPVNTEHHHQTGDPSIEPTSFPRINSASAQRQSQQQQGSEGRSSSRHPSDSSSKKKLVTMPRIRETRSAAAQRYAQPIPQSAFLSALRERERVLHKRITSSSVEGDNALSRGVDIGGGRPVTAEAHQEVKQHVNSHDQKRVQKVLRSFPTTSVRDPFCPKPPVHASAIRLEASVLAAQRMFRPATEPVPSERNRAASAKGSTSTVRNLMPNNTVALPPSSSQLNTSSPTTTAHNTTSNNSVNRGTLELPILVTSYADDDESSVASPLRHSTAQSPNSKKGERLTLRAGGRPFSGRTHDDDQHLGPAGMDALLQYLPKGYAEPEVLMTRKPLDHPNDPVTGKPRPSRHYRLGFTKDPANDMTPAEAAAALQHRGLPTTLSVASTDPAVLAIVDSFIESSPGLEHVELGAMDDRYEMVLRNVFAALSRNVSVEDVKGVFPKEATKAFKSTISANSELRKKRLDQLASKEMELKISDMEQRILKERQDHKKRYFEHMRQRTRLCDQHMRGYRDLLRDEAFAWERLYGHEDASLQDVREKERRRFEWWSAGVDALEQEMSALRLFDSREEHQIRERLRLDEVNQRMAAQVELRRFQKQLDNDRHVIMAEQFELRKRIRQDEKTLRRSMEQVMQEHLRLFLEHRAKEDRRKKDEENLRRQDEAYKAERIRRLQQAQEILETNEFEKRKTTEVEAWKAYDVFKRKHFEGIVVAKNQQRVREIREKRQAAFTAADNAVPMLHFRMTPQSVSTAGIPSAIQSANNTLAYYLNPVGDFLVLNSNAILGVGFDADMTPLMGKQKLAKVEPQGGVISCFIQRGQQHDIDEGREGIALFVSTSMTNDPNVAVLNHTEKEVGRVILPPSSSMRDRSPETTRIPSPNEGSPVTRVGSGGAGSPANRRTSLLASASDPQSGKGNIRRGRSGSLIGQLKSHGLLGSGGGGGGSSQSPSRPNDELEVERTLHQLCGEDRVCGTIRIRDEMEDSSLRGKEVSSVANNKSGTTDFLQDAKKGHAEVTTMFDGGDVQMETESDGSDDSFSSTSSKDKKGSAGTTRKPRTGFGSMMTLNSSPTIAKRPKRRVVTWNGIDVGVVELGYAGAPMESSGVIPYYNNTAIQRIRTRQSAIAVQVEKRRGTIDVRETTSPNDAAAPLKPLKRSSSEAPNSGIGAADDASASNAGQPQGVEVFRIRLFPNVPRHAMSDILGHLSYFNSAGVTSLRHSAMEQLASNEVVQVCTHVSIAYRRSCLPPPSPVTAAATQLSPTSPFLKTRGSGERGFSHSPARDSGVVGFITTAKEKEVFLKTPETDELRKVSDLSDMSVSRRRGQGRRKSCDPSIFYGMDTSQLVWSTRSTNSYVKLHLPLFFGVPQREPVYFLEDQPPMRLVNPNKFGYCFPVASSYASTAAVDALLAGGGAIPPTSINQDASVASFGFGGSEASSNFPPQNYLTNGGKSIVVRDMTDLDPVDVIAGRGATCGMHVMLSIIGHSRGDVFVLLNHAGLTLGPECDVPHTPQESEVGALLPYGRRMVDRLGDCTRKQVGIEVMKQMREVYYHGELVAYVTGMILTPKEFEDFGPWFVEDAAAAPSESSMSTTLFPTTRTTPPSLSPPQVGHVLSPVLATPPSGLHTTNSGRNLKALSRTLSSAACKRGPVEIVLLSTRFVTMACLRDIIGSCAYANLNKDPSPVKRYVDVCVADKNRRNSALSRSEITVVPVDDITEINLKTPAWGFRVCRAPAETKPELAQYLPAELPFFIAPDAVAVDPDTVYFEGGWLEVEIVEGAKDGDVLYILQDDRMFIDQAHTWSVETVRQCSRLYAERRAGGGGNRFDGNHSRDARALSVAPEAEMFSFGGRLLSASTEFQGATGGGPLGISPAVSPLGPPVRHGSGEVFVVGDSGSLGGSAEHKSPTTIHPILSMGVFSDDEDEPHSEMVVTSGLALEEIPPMVSRREMSKGRSSFATTGPGGAAAGAGFPNGGGSFSLSNTPAANPLGSPDSSILRPPLPMLSIPQGRPSLAPDMGTPGLENMERNTGSSGLHYTSPMLRIEFRSLSLAGLQYLLRHIAFKSVAATEKNPKYFGQRTIEFRTIVGDPNVPKFRKFDPFVPIVNRTCIKVCEPLLKTVSTQVHYKEGQGTMGIPVGLCEPGTDGYRCFNRGHFSASIVKGATPDDRLIIRSIDPSQFDFGLSFLDIDPLTMFQPKRAQSLYNLKRQSSMRSGGGGHPPPQQLAPAQQTYVPGAGGVGPDGEINANCPPPPASLSAQWVKSIVSGKYKFQQWKCAELYNNERAMVGFLTATFSEVYVGFREADKVRKFGRAVATASTPAAGAASSTTAGAGGGGVPLVATASLTNSGLPSPPTKFAASASATMDQSVMSMSPLPPSSASLKKKKPGKEKSLTQSLNAEKESRAIPIPLPEGATPVRYSDVLSITKLISYENRSNNPTDLKKVILISLSDEHTTSHIVVELTVQPVDDVTEIRKSFQGPLSYRNGFVGSYVPMFDHCSLFDPDTEFFNGGHMNISMAQVPTEGDSLRFLSLDEQRKHREIVGKDAFSKYRTKPGIGGKGEQSSAGSQRSDGGGAAAAGVRKLSPGAVRSGLTAPAAAPRGGAAGKSPIRAAPKSPNRRGTNVGADATGAVLDPMSPVKPPEPPKEKDPNEPYEFVLDHKRKVIYWVDRNKDGGNNAPKLNQSGSSHLPHMLEITAPTPSHGGRYIQSGAFQRETPVNATAPMTFGAFARQELKLPDESVLRRIATYVTNVESKSKQKASPTGTTLITAPPTAMHSRNASDGNLADASPPPGIHITDSNAATGSEFDATALVDPSLAFSMMDLHSLSQIPSIPVVATSINIQIKLEPIIDEDDMEEGDTSERAAPVNINMLQALMRSVVYQCTTGGTRTKTGSRLFSARIGSAGGGEDGKAKVAVQVAGALIGWIDNITPTMTFRPRMGQILPLARMLFLSDLILKTGFVLIEVCEGFEPSEDVIKLNDIGRMMIVKNGKIFLQPKDQLIGNLIPQEVDGTPYGFLIAIDQNCRVSGSVLQSLCRSFSYTNTSRRTSQRKIRVTVCDGTIYDTSIIEVPITIEQDEHTVPARFGPSNGSVVWMDGGNPVRVFPDLTLTLKGQNTDRILEPPNLLDFETQPGGMLNIVSTDNVDVDAQGTKITIDGEEVAKLYQADLTEGYDRDSILTPRHPQGSRKSFSRMSMSTGAGRRMTRDGSVVSLAAGSTNNSSGGATTSLGGLVSPNVTTSQPRLSPRSPIATFANAGSANATLLSSSGNSGSINQSASMIERPPPNSLRVEFTSCKMEYLEKIIKCLRFSCPSSTPANNAIVSPTNANGSGTTTVALSTVGNHRDSIEESATILAPVTTFNHIQQLVTRPPAPHPPQAPSSNNRDARRSIVRFGAATDGEGAGSVGGLGGSASMAFTAPSLPSQFTVTLQLTGIANDVGRISNTASLHLQAMVRICESTALFTVPPSAISQGIAGDVFNGINVRFTPRWIRLNWRAPLELQRGEEDFEEAQELNARNAAAAAAASSLQVFVSNRLGLVVSASGDEISYGRDKIASVITKTSYNRSHSICRSKSVTALGSSSSPSDLAELSSKDSPLFTMQEAIDDDFNLTDQMNRSANSEAQQLIFELSTTRRIPPETISRLLRSIVTHPTLTLPVQFSLSLEASDEVSTTRTLVVIPHGSGTRRSSHRGSVGGMVRGVVGLARLGSQRRSVTAPMPPVAAPPAAPAKGVVEKVGRQRRPKKAEE